MPPRREDPIDTASLIAPLGNAGRAGEIAARLTQAIQLGLLGDGEQLPPEIEFAEHLGVAPMTLREAITMLRSNGLVETRRGRNGGTFVKRYLEPPEEPDAERLRAMPVSALRDLADEQGAISVAAARLAADRAAARDVRRIVGLVDQLATAISRGARIKADSRFHIEIAIATRSERLLRREVALQAECSGMLWLPGPGDELDRVVDEHRDIAVAIEAEDPAGAQVAAARHVRENLRRLTDGHRALTREPNRGRNGKVGEPA